MSETSTALTELALHFEGTASPVSEAELVELERNAEMRIPPRLRRALAEWGWGTLADLFALCFLAERPDDEDLAVLAKLSPAVKRATWVLLGGDESRSFSLYGAAIDDTTLFALKPTGKQILRIGLGEEALFAWMQGKGLDRLYDDPFGVPIPIPYTSHSIASVDECLRAAFTSKSTSRAEEAIESMLTFRSRRRVGWEALQLLMDSDFAISERRRKELTALVLRFTKKHLWKALGAHPGLRETVESLKKTGRSRSQPTITIDCPTGIASATYDARNDFVHVSASGVSGCWMVAVTSTGADGITRKNQSMVLHAQGGSLSPGMGMGNAPHIIHVELRPASAENDHLVRGVNRFFHEDGSVSEGTGHGDLAALANRSPLHREDGPAEMHGSPYFWPGRTGWWRHGKLHREDGPALVVPAYGAATDPHRGFSAYYVNGVLHRERGPAVLYANGDFEWWTHGTRREETAEEAADRLRESRR